MNEINIDWFSEGKISLELGSNTCWILHKHTHVDNTEVGLLLPSMTLVSLLSLTTDLGMLGCYDFPLKF